MSLRFYLFASDVKQGNRDFGFKKVGSRFSHVAPGMERFSQNLLRAFEIKNMLW